MSFFGFKSAAVKAAIECDDAFCRRLFAELGSLATQAKTLAYSNGTSESSRQLDLISRLRHLASTIGRFPSLPQGRETLPGLESLAEQSKTACACLDRMWGILTSNATDMTAYEEAVIALEIAIKRRQSV